MSDETVNDSSSSIHSIHRVGEYPLVKDTITKVAEYYQWAKTKNPTLGNTLQWTEDGAKKVATTVEPLATSKIGTYMDCMICSQLDKLEEKCPDVLKPTDEIITKSKEYYDENLKGKVDNVIIKAASVKHSFDQAVNVSTKAITAPVQSTAAVLNYAVDFADTCVDKWLQPVVPEEKDQNVDNSIAILSKVSRLSSKTQKRLYSKAVRELKKITDYSNKSIIQLKMVINMLETQKRERLESIGQLRREYQQILASVVESKEEAETSTDNSLNDRLMQAAVYYTGNLKLAVYAAGTIVYRHLSPENKSKFDDAVNRVQELYKNLRSTSLQSINETIINESKSNIDWVQTTLNTSVNSVQEYVSEKFQSTNGSSEGEITGNGTESDNHSFDHDHCDDNSRMDENGASNHGSDHE